MPRRSSSRTGWRDYRAYAAGAPEVYIEDDEEPLPSWWPDRCPDCELGPVGDCPCVYEEGATMAKREPFAMDRDPEACLWRDWTAREHLAAMAMEGVLAGNAPNMNPDDIASYSFAVADALIAEAARREGGDDGE